MKHLRKQPTQLLLAGLLGLSPLTSPSMFALDRTARFDTTETIQWTAEGMGSQRLPTNFAGGTMPGEGSIQPVRGGKVIFADTTIGPLSIDGPLLAVGRVVWRMNNAERSQRGIHLGFFDKNSYSTFVGIGFYGGSSMSRAFIIHESSRGAITVNAQAPLGQLSTGTSSAKNYAFEMRWSPETNRLDVAIEGLGLATVQLTAEQRAAFSSDLNAFGLFVPDAAGAGVQFMIDDVSYTTAAGQVVTSRPKSPAAQTSPPVAQLKQSPQPSKPPAPTRNALSVTSTAFDISTTSQAAFQAHSDDLVNKGSPYLKELVNQTYTPTPPQFGSIDKINDGSVGGPSVPADGLLQTSGEYSLVFNLDTEKHPAGYDIEEIRVIAAWEAQRAAQHVKVQAALVGSEEIYDIGTAKQESFGGGKNNASLLTILGPESGLIASGVRALRFTMLPVADNPASNYGVYREIDVIGRPSAGTSAPSVNRASTAADFFNERHGKRAAEVRAAAGAYEPVAGVPTLDYFHTPGLPVWDVNPDELLLPYDAPTITNNRIWVQAVSEEQRNGILDLENVWAGAEVQEGTLRYTLTGRWRNWNDPLWSTTKVRMNGGYIAPDSQSGDWLPNTITRSQSVDGLKFVGINKTAAGHMSILQRLDITNTTEESRVVELDFLFSPASGEYALMDSPAANSQEGEYQVHSLLLELAPGETRSVKSVLSYREPAGLSNQLLGDFDAEWQLADDYWNALLVDAYTPEAGPFLSGGAPLLTTEKEKEERFYNFGVVTALMVMTNSADRLSESNLYKVAVADAPYMPWLYMWDSSYGAEAIALLDPEALKSMLSIWCGSGIQVAAAADSSSGKPMAQWYASNFSSFLRMLKTYAYWTGDFEFLNHEVDGRSVLQHVLDASAFNDARPQRNGLMHANGEHYLFDRGTVKGYQHYVAFPNMGDVWGKRVIAYLLDTHGEPEDAEKAIELRAKADARALAIIRELYTETDGEGTWKQIHENGNVLHLRHGIDFMHGGMSLNDELSQEQKQAMRDWWYNQIYLYSAEGGTWVISQDRRDGNNGPHQMEHNGNGAYPGWPYHYAWALHEMGFQDDVQMLLDLIVNITDWGAIGQGHARDGRRSRSGWAEVAGAFPVAYITNFIFGIDPANMEATPIHTLSPEASLEGLRWRGNIYDIDSTGQTTQRS